MDHSVLPVVKRTPGSRSDVGPEYRNKVITYIAAKVAVDENVEDFVIYSKLEGVGQFDDLILKLWFKEENEPNLYLFKIRHKSRKPIPITYDTIIKYTDSFKKFTQSKSNIDIFRDVSSTNIKLCFFSNNVQLDTTENTKKSF